MEVLLLDVEHVMYRNWPLAWLVGCWYTSEWQKDYTGSDKMTFFMTKLCLWSLLQSLALTSSKSYDEECPSIEIDGSVWIGSMPEKMFCHCSYTQCHDCSIMNTLSIMSIAVHSIHQNAFLCLDNLQSLSLHYGKLEHLEENVFKPLHNLGSLAIACMFICWNYLHFLNQWTLLTLDHYNGTPMSIVVLVEWVKLRICQIIFLHFQGI